MDIDEKQNKDINSKIHKLEENKYNNIRIWKQKQNTLSDGIIPKINYNKRIVKEALNNIMGEENEDINKIKINNIKRKSELKVSTSSKNLDQVSPYSKRILKKINKHIKKIKDSSEDIIAMNALYLDNHMFPSKTNKNNIRYNNSLSKSEHIKFAITPNNKNLNNSKDNIINENNYNEAIQKKDRRNNFLYVNSNYRKQLNKAFLRYNPMIYLNNLKILLQVSPSIRDDVQKTKNEVEEDIRALCDKHRYSKKLNAYLSKNARSRSVEMLSPNNNIYKSNDNLKRKNNLSINTNINANLNNINANNNRNSNLIKDDNSKNSNSNNKPTFSFLPKIPRDKILGSPKELKVGFGLFEKLKRKESQKVLSIKEQKIEEANKIYKIINEIDNFMKKENIGEKVDKYIGDYKLQKYLNQFKDNEIDTSLKGKDYYREQKDKINGMLGLLYTDKIQKKTLEKEREYNRRLKRDKYDYFLKIDCELKKNLQEFDEDLRSKKIDLNINNESEDESSNLVSRKPSSL
jgi:hypothetical protein